MSIQIREARTGDTAAIVAGNAAIARETEDRELDSATLRHGVSRLFAEPERGRYWLAEIDGRIAGQLMVTHEWSDWRNGDVWWIQSVYVHPEFRRRGVYTALYRHVGDLARETPDVCGLRLYVESANVRAQQTYAALGMRDSGYLVMEFMIDDTASQS